MVAAFRHNVDAGAALARSAHAPTVGAKASCRNPVMPARVIEPFVDYPKLAEERGDSGIAGVGIALATSGRPQRVWLVQSSGMPTLDAAAMQAARMSGYAAERENCNSVAGSYLLQVEFSEDDRADS